MAAPKFIDTTQETCLPVVPWFPRNHWPLADFPFITLQLQLVVVYCLTQAIHRLFFKRIGLPPLLSQLLAGIILSPTVYDYKGVKVTSKVSDLIFPPASDQVRRCISMLGFALSMFMTAVKMDFTMIRRTGSKPIIIGLSVLIVAGVTNALVAKAYVTYYFDPETDKTSILDITSTGPLMALTSFPVIGALLSDLNLLNSELGRLALSSGIVSDVTSIVFNMMSKSVSINLQNRDATSELAVQIGKNVILIVCMVFGVFVLRKLLKWMIKETPKGRPVKEQYLILVFALMLIGGLVTNYNEQFILLGCFIVGAAIPEGPPLGSGIVDKFDFLVSEVLHPFFISTTAMGADIFEVVQLRGIFAQGRHLLVLSSYATKIAVCLFYGFVFKMNFHDALALAGIMSSKGFVDIGNFVMFKQLKLIKEETHSYLILVATIASFVVPLSIKLFYNPLRKYAGYEKRCIMHSKDDPNLRLLACVCRSDNVSAISNLLSLTMPTMANPMTVNVLQLIKLVGRAQPIFVSHNLQQKKSSAQFDDIIWAFNGFKQGYSPKALTMSFYTVVSPPKAMHEDVCTLALDSLASVIILPFHRKLSIDGHIDLDDNVQRTLNKSVLEAAPCSVGILVDRGYKRHTISGSSSGRRTSSSIGSSSHLRSIAIHQSIEEEEVVKVAVIFIGGKDDQEAVAYAKRMTSAMVKIQVIRLIGSGYENILSSLDSSALDGIRENDGSFNSHITYTEIKVKDGPDTAKFLRSTMENFDLMIVGRRVGHDENCIQTSGLEVWSEVPELGILGDLLAQSDLKCRTSVLVIQQQKQWTLNNDDEFTSAIK